MGVDRQTIRLVQAFSPLDGPTNCYFRRESSALCLLKIILSEQKILINLPPCIFLSSQLQSEKSSKNRLITHFQQSVEYSRFCIRRGNVPEPYFPASNMI